MTVVVVEETRGAHCPVLCANLRAGDRRECEDAGLAPRRAIYRSYRNSLYARTVFFDGDMAGMFGLGGGALSDTGSPWLFTTPAVERNPFAFLRCARAFVDEMLTIKPMLENFVSANYPEACRFLRALGFELSEPQPYGVKGAPFRKFSMRAG